eukprot:Selendium_serpulae@DN371_c0_g1_i1.p1
MIPGRSMAPPPGVPPLRGHGSPKKTGAPPVPSLKGPTSYFQSPRKGGSRPQQGSKHRPPPQRPVHAKQDEHQPVPKHPMRPPHAPAINVRAPSQGTAPQSQMRPP